MLHAASLRNSGKLDEAETLLRKAMESIRQPDEHGARFLDEYGLASIFMERKNWREAQSRLISAQPPAEMRRFCRGFITLNDEAKLRWAVQATIEADALVPGGTAAPTLARHRNIQEAAVPEGSLKSRQPEPLADNVRSSRRARGWLLSSSVGCPR